MTPTRLRAVESSTKVSDAKAGAEVRSSNAWDDSCLDPQRAFARPYWMLSGASVAVVVFCLLLMASRPQPVPAQGHPSRSPP